MPYRFRSNSRVREWLVPTSAASLLLGAVVMVLTVGPYAAMLALPVLAALSVLAGAMAWARHAHVSHHRHQRRRVRVDDLPFMLDDEQTAGETPAPAGPPAAGLDAEPAPAVRRAA